ncbi:hypothetical protein OQJ18_12815 [Fluoribacter dumoffii]|uniref:Transmembrane protein n=1 Tax=Fluoribacter dumoffii TaxID=463 RepID=A0A377GE79_9GAMM|nr:hypothetical protein [Fluoribacter dumoffii]KTC91402.1 transmembrane protein [Fluoribacter dumoffii NY 23]MCW8387468.1 hypothetical protein [Fluoribacter dumoffii]MCW8417024.1 hypothetical protein [Fluoribacter dumoffii]MCW8455136.1 hypothetical protein [Fluoribacter dumoffii]MCW8460787.1 hypothetical protein [Fluoribacter dumoffii]
MSNKDEKSSSFLNSKELVFLLAIAGRIDAQSRLLAQKLDQDRYIYHAYAVLDSLSSSYSMFKYFLEVFLAKNDPVSIHRILTSPEGIAAVTAEALFLVSFSFFASVFDGEENDSVKKFIAAAWPYFRDVMKGLKNAYKGWRSTVQVLSLISGMDLKYMIVPVGLVLGLFAAANRYWIRGMVEQRKKFMNENKELLIEIQQLTSLTPIDRSSYLSRIKYQDVNERLQAYFAVGIGGLIDGLYLYMGVGSLAIFAPPLFIAMSVLGAFYTLACVVSRIYEEYDFQLRLEITQTRCKLALTTKELELTYAKLLELNDHRKTEDLLEIFLLKQNLCQLIREFEEERELLQNQTSHTYLTAALLGMKYGLFAYGVVTSILFTVASVCLITASTFPPLLLAGFIISGLALMIGMTAYMLYTHHQFLQQQKIENEKDHPFAQIQEMKKNLEAQNDTSILTSDNFKTSLKDGLAISSSPQSFFQERCEVGRSLASGLSKGYNFSNFVMTPTQEIDAEGHLHDTPIMGALAIANGVLFSSVLGLRALARGLGRSPQGQPNAPKTKETNLEEGSVRKIKTQSKGESGEQVKNKAPDSLSRGGSFFSSWSFFFHKNLNPQKTSPDRTLPHSRSDTDLTQHTSTTLGGSTIRGLD